MSDMPDGTPTAEDLARYERNRKILEKMSGNGSEEIRDRVDYGMLDAKARKEGLSEDEVEDLRRLRSNLIAKFRQAGNTETMTEAWKEWLRSHGVVFIKETP